MTDALMMLTKQEPIYAYAFEGERYDVGNKQGFLKATVDYALAREDLKDEFTAFLKQRVQALK